MTYDERTCGFEFCDETFIPKTHNHTYHDRRCKDAQARLNELEPSTRQFANSYFTDFVDTKLWERREGALLRELDRERNRTQAILEVIKRHTPRQLPPIEVPKVNAEPVHARVLFADTQIGKLNRGKGMKSTEDYVHTLLSNVIKNILVASKTYSVECIFFHGLGDIVENCGMFPTQVYELDYENDGHLVFKQVLFTIDLIENFIRNLHRLGIPIVVDNAPGNHGRRAPSKSQDVSAVEDNYDTLVMLLVEKLCKDLDNITWNIPEKEWYSVSESFGWKFATAHGHQFTGTSNTSFEKWVLNHAATGTWGAVDVVLLGHRHHPLTLTVGSEITVIQSGALDGGSDWFLAKTGRDSGPSQEMMLVSERGIIQRNTIRVGDYKPRKHLFTGD